MPFFPRRGSDKRRQYRVQSDKELGVSLQNAGEWAAVSLLDVSSRGAALFVPGSLRPAAPEGAEFVLRFALRGRGRVVEARAAVRTVEEAASQHEQGSRWGMEFLDPEALYEVLDPGYWHYFNRRKSYRLALVRGRPQARVDSNGREFMGQVADLCVAGAGVLFPRDTPLLLVPGARARLEFAVPGLERGERFECRVVHRGSCTGALAAGLEFDPERSAGFGEAQERIREHVMRRQRELLQGGG